MTAVDEEIVDVSDIDEGLELAKKAIRSVKGYIKYLESTISNLRPSLTFAPIHHT